MPSSYNPSAASCSRTNHIIGNNIDCQGNKNGIKHAPHHQTGIEDDMDVDNEITETPESNSSTTIPPFVLKATFIASLGGILFGYDMGVISGALPQLALAFDLSEESQETIVSFLYLGGGLGAAVGGAMCDYTGRRRTIIITDILFVFGALLLYASQTYHQILGGRLLVGFAVSVSGIADVSYLHEISPTQWRGSIVSVNEACISLGFLLAYLASYWISMMFPPTDGWRIMFGLSSFVAVIQMVGMIWFMPESPIWLREKGLFKEAEEAMSIIMQGTPPQEQEVQTSHNTKDSIDEEIASNSTEKIKSASEQKLLRKDASFISYDTMDEKGTVATDLVTDDDMSSISSPISRAPSPQNFQYQNGHPHQHDGNEQETGNAPMQQHRLNLHEIRKPLIVAMFLSIAQQFVGHTNVLNFAPEILNQVGLTSPQSSLGLTLCLGCIKFLATGMVIWKIEKCGRKTLLLGGMACMMISQGFLSIAFMGMGKDTDADEDNSERVMGLGSMLLSVVGLFGVVVGYSASFGPLTWLLTSEMFPASIRGRALGMSTIVTYLSASLISYTFLTGQALLGPSVPFAIYSIICMLSLIFTFLAIPDTGGKSPEEIETEMRSMWWWKQHFCSAGKVRREIDPEEEWDIETVGLNFAKP